MGFDEGRIILESPNGAYYSGQFVSGRVVFELSKDKKVRGIFLKAKGFCKVHWTTNHTRRNNDRTEHYTVSHDSYEEYISLKTYLIGGKGDEHHLNPGKHEYPFRFQLPDTCPSSFEGEHGHVRYELKVVADRPFKVDQEIHHPLRVIQPLDLNLMNCKEPVEFEFEQTYCCWCMNAGSSETLIKMPVTGYCPGQVIPLEVSCRNPSSVEIDEIKFSIKKDITFRAESAPDQKNEHSNILDIRKGPIPAHTDRNWTVELPVPNMVVYNLNGCSYIDIKYTFKVTVEPEGCHSNSDDSCEIIFGTIPLVGFQDTVRNPLQDQMPQTNTIPQNYPPPGNPYPQPVINQPLTQNPYPGVNPYPNQPYQPAAPYPNSVNPAYPGHIDPNRNSVNPSISPFPSPNPPYPNPQVSPYPNPAIGNSPLPNPQPNNSPYPNPTQGNSPYPNPSQDNSPFPNPSQGNSPYPNPPQGNSPYQNPSQGNSPYPNPTQDNSPYPNPSQDNSPYPNPSQGNSPYSNPTQGNSPYPNPSQGNSPYPNPSQGNSPYPYPSQGNSPHRPPPQGNSPYRNSRQGHPPYPVPNICTPLLLDNDMQKSGDPGNNGPSLGPVPMPALPPGALPYPPNAHSPYASASAPAPATPDELKPKLEDNANSSPYNPEFLKGDAK